VDGARAAGDPFKLSSTLLTLVTDRLAAFKAKNAGATMVLASTLSASQQRQDALDRMANLLRNGYNYIGSVASDDISDAERLQCYTAYGWDQGNMGDLRSATRIQDLANLAVSATADATVPTAGKYPATLVTRISNWHATYDAANLLATGGSREVLIAQRNVATSDLQSANSRTRLFYCSASDDGESTPELSKINMQPKRGPGEAQPQRFPDAPGATTFDAATRELTIPGMPDHGGFIRAYRQPAGGSAELAGAWGNYRIDS
jgi:hypothetical protein